MITALPKDKVADDTERVGVVPPPPDETVLAVKVTFLINTFLDALVPLAAANTNARSVRVCPLLQVMARLGNDRLYTALLVPVVTVPTVVNAPPSTEVARLTFIAPADPLIFMVKDNAETERLNPVLGDKGKSS